MTVDRFNMLLEKMSSCRPDRDSERHARWSDAMNKVTDRASEIGATMRVMKIASRDRD